MSSLRRFRIKVSCCAGVSSSVGSSRSSTLSAGRLSHLGVAMGPRNRRRLTTAGIGSAVIAAIVVAVWLTRSPGHSGSALSGRSPEQSSASHAPKLTFGMTPQQVRRLTGNPTTTRGSCWLFRPEAGIVGSIVLGQRGSIARRSPGALKLCFYGGALSTAYRHIRFNGRWEWISQGQVGGLPR
jgi:hypothetical protein